MDQEKKQRWDGWVNKILRIVNNIPKSEEKQTEWVLLAFLSSALSVVEKETKKQ